MSLNKAGNMHLKSTLDSSPPPDWRELLPSLTRLTNDDLVPNTDYKIQKAALSARPIK